MRKTSFDVAREVLKVLKKESNLSVKAIADKINSQWDTTNTALEFLKETGLVKEKNGSKAYRTERLFSIK